MNIVINLPPDIAPKVELEASRKGMDVADYIEDVVRRLVTSTIGETIAAESQAGGQIGPDLVERARAWQAWAAGHDSQMPVILLDSREVIYRDDA